MAHLTNRFILLLCLGLVTFTLILRQLQPYLSSSQSHAFSPPAFKRSWTCHQPQNAGQHTRQQKRVAIIGAGSAGSSAAYYLRNFTGDCYDLTIDVFERNDYIGGRSTTVDVFDDPAAGITAELGGSIFVEVNHNLVAAARRFGLKTTAASFEARQKGRDKGKGKGKGKGRGLRDDDENEAADRFGVWDGSRFVFTQPANEAYWRTVLRMLWRYGLSPLRTQTLMRSTVGAFLRLYDEPFFPFAELSEAVMAVGLTNATAQTGSAFLAANGIAAPFSTDLIQASTRVNYAQNLAQIHGVETMVCMATDGAMAVEGGNWRIFGAMLAHAEAAVHLNNTVTAIRKVRGDGRHDYKDDMDAEGKLGARGGPYYEITVADSADASSTRTPATRYDDVIIAGPYQYSGISLLPHGGVTKLPDPIEYVQLHVTLFTTPYRLQPEYFGLNKSEDVPGTILTTLPNNAQCLKSHTSSSSSAGFDNDNDSYEDASTQATAECSEVGPRDFLSISTLAKVTNPQTQEDEYLYKIFSHQPVRAGLLQRLFLGTQIPADGAGDMRARAGGANKTNNRNNDEESNVRKTKGEPAVAAAATATAGHLADNGEDREESNHDGREKDGSQGSGGEYNPEVGPGVEDGVTAWSHVKVWHSYPYLPPRVTFEEPVLAPGLWYTAGIESFISTMETSSLMGMNVAALAVKRWREQDESGSAVESEDGQAVKDAPSMHADRPEEL